MNIFKRIQYNSPVILTFSLLSFLSLCLAYITMGQSTMLLFSVYKSSFSDPLAYIRIFSHVLGHIGFNHYINNFLLILLIGPMLEEKYGSINLIIMIVATALITGLLNILLFNTALLGASGIVFMLILLSSYVNLQKGRIPVTLILIIIIFIGREILDGLFTADNISHITHIVGGVCGAILGYLINKKNLS